MKIYNEVILSWDEKKQQLNTVYENSYDYYGLVDYTLGETCYCQGLNNVCTPLCCENYTGDDIFAGDYSAICGGGDPPPPCLHGPTDVSIVCPLDPEDEAVVDTSFGYSSQQLYWEVPNFNLPAYAAPKLSTTKKRIGNPLGNFLIIDKVYSYNADNQIGNLTIVFGIERETLTDNWCEVNVNNPSWKYMGTCPSLDASGICQDCDDISSDFPSDNPVNLDIQAFQLYLNWEIFLNSIDDEGFSGVGIPLDGSVSIIGSTPDELPNLLLHTNWADGSLGDNNCYNEGDVSLRIVGIQGVDSTPAIPSQYGVDSSQEIFTLSITFDHPYSANITENHITKFLNSPGCYSNNLIAGTSSEVSHHAYTEGQDVPHILYFNWKSSEWTGDGEIPWCAVHDCNLPYSQDGGVTDGGFANLDYFTPTLDALSADGLQIRKVDCTVGGLMQYSTYYSGFGWFGDVNEIEEGNCYKFQMNETSRYTSTGLSEKPIIDREKVKKYRQGGYVQTIIDRLNKKKLDKIIKAESIIEIPSLITPECFPPTCLCPNNVCHEECCSAFNFLDYLSAIFNNDIDEVMVTGGWCYSGGMEGETQYFPGPGGGDGFWCPDVANGGYGPNSPNDGGTGGPTASQDPPDYTAYEFAMPTDAFNNNNIDYESYNYLPTTIGGNTSGTSNIGKPLANLIITDSDYNIFDNSVVLNFSIGVKRDYTYTNPPLQICKSELSGDNPSFSFLGVCDNSSCTDCNLIQNWDNQINLEINAIQLGFNLDALGIDLSAGIQATVTSDVDLWNTDVAIQTDNGLTNTMCHNGAQNKLSLVGYHSTVGLSDSFGNSLTGAPIMQISLTINTNNTLTTASIDSFLNSTGCFSDNLVVTNSSKAIDYQDTSCDMCPIFDEVMPHVLYTGWIPDGQNGVYDCCDKGEDECLNCWSCTWNENDNYCYSSRFSTGQLITDFPNGTRASCFEHHCQPISGYDNCEVFSEGNCNSSSDYNDISCHWCPDLEGGACVNVDDANILDAICETIYGCTNSNATNYDENANVDNGTCTMPTSGCTDSLACNYDSIASFDDNTCIYPTADYFGVECCDGYNGVLSEKVFCCVDINPVNGHCDANIEDELSCFECPDSWIPTDSPDEIPGCMDDGTDISYYESNSNRPSPDIFNSPTWINELHFDSTSPACNYNPDATIEDSSCVYGTECWTGMFYCDEYQGADGTIVSTFIDECPVTDFITFSHPGIEGDIQIPFNSFSQTIEIPMTAIGTVYYGCTDYTACNYDASANVDDDTCQFSGGPIYSCITGAGWDSYDPDNSAELSIPYDCDCNCLLEIDDCGICGGQGATYGITQDCCLPQIDYCDVCFGVGISENICDCSSSEFDECGTCGGTNVYCTKTTSEDTPIEFDIIQEIPEYYDAIVIHVPDIGTLTSSEGDNWSDFQYWRLYQFDEELPTLIYTPPSNFVGVVPIKFRYIKYDNTGQYTSPYFEKTINIIQVLDPIQAPNVVVDTFEDIPIDFEITCYKPESGIGGVEMNIDFLGQPDDITTDIGTFELLGDIIYIGNVNTIEAGAYRTLRYTPAPDYSGQISGIQFECSTNIETDTLVTGDLTINVESSADLIAPDINFSMWEDDVDASISNSIPCYFDSDNFPNNFFDDVSTIEDIVSQHWLRVTVTPPVNSSGTLECINCDLNDFSFGPNNIDYVFSPSNPLLFPTNISLKYTLTQPNYSGTDYATYTCEIVDPPFGQASDGSFNYPEEVLFSTQGIVKMVVQDIPDAPIILPIQLNKYNDVNFGEKVRTLYDSGTLQGTDFINKSDFVGVNHQWTGVDNSETDMFYYVDIGPFSRRERSMDATRAQPTNNPEGFSIPYQGLGLLGSHPESLYVLANLQNTMTTCEGTSQVFCSTRTYCHGVCWNQSAENNSNFNYGWLEDYSSMPTFINSQNVKSPNFTWDMVNQPNSDYHACHCGYEYDGGASFAWHVPARPDDYWAVGWGLTPGCIDEGGSFTCGNNDVTSDDNWGNWSGLGQILSIDNQCIFGAPRYLDDTLITTDDILYQPSSPGYITNTPYGNHTCDMTGRTSPWAQGIVRSECPPFTMGDLGDYKLSDIPQVTKAPFFDPVRAENSILSMNEDTEAYFVVRTYNPSGYDTDSNKIDITFNITEGLNPEDVIIELFGTNEYQLQDEIPSQSIDTTGAWCQDDAYDNTHYWGLPANTMTPFTIGNTYFDPIWFEQYNIAQPPNAEPDLTVLDIAAWGNTTGDLSGENEFATKAIEKFIVTDINPPNQIVNQFSGGTLGMFQNFCAGPPISLAKSHEDTLGGKNQHENSWTNLTNIQLLSSDEDSIMSYLEYMTEYHRLNPFMHFCHHTHLGYQYPQNNIILENVYKITLLPNYYNKTTYYGQSDYDEFNLPVKIEGEVTNSDNCSGECSTNFDFKLSVIEKNDPVHITMLSSPESFTTPGLIHNSVELYGDDLQEYETIITSPVQEYGNVYTDEYPSEYTDPHDIGYWPMDGYNYHSPPFEPTNDWSYQLYSSHHIDYQFSVNDADITDVFGFENNYLCEDLTCQNGNPCNPLQVIDNITNGADFITSNYAELWPTRPCLVITHPNMAEGSAFMNEKKFQYTLQVLDTTQDQYEGNTTNFKLYVFPHKGLTNGQELNFSILAFDGRASEILNYTQENITTNIYKEYGDHSLREGCMHPLANYAESGEIGKIQLEDLKTSRPVNTCGDTLDGGVSRDWIDESFKLHIDTNDDGNFNLSSDGSSTLNVDINNITPLSTHQGINGVCSNGDSCIADNDCNDDSNCIYFGGRIKKELGIELPSSSGTFSTSYYDDSNFRVGFNDMDVLIDTKVYIKGKCGLLDNSPSNHRIIAEKFTLIINNYSSNPNQLHHYYEYFANTNTYTYKEECEQTCLGNCFQNIYDTFFTDDGLNDSDLNKWFCSSHQGLAVDNSFTPTFSGMDWNGDYLKFRLPIKIFNDNSTSLFIKNVDVETYDSSLDCSINPLSCPGYPIDGDSCIKTLYIDKIEFSLPGVVDEPVSVNPSDTTPPVGLNYFTITYEDAPCYNPIPNNTSYDNISYQQLFTKDMCETYEGEWNSNGEVIHPPTYQTGLVDDEVYPTLKGQQAMQFVFESLFWEANGFSFADLEQVIVTDGGQFTDNPFNQGGPPGYELGYNSPKYGQITKNGEDFQADSLPEWYGNAGDTYSWKHDGDTFKQYVYQLNNVESTPISNGTSYIWEYMCNPWNDVIKDNFTMGLRIRSSYLGEDYNMYYSGGFPGLLHRSTDLNIINDNPVYSCNNFTLDSTNDFYNDIQIDLKVNRASEALSFNQISRLYCGDLSICEPKLLYEELITAVDSVIIGGVDDNPTEIEYNFIVDAASAGNCEIELIMEDAEHSYDTATEFYFNEEFIGKLSSGLHSDVWNDDNPNNDIYYGYNFCTQYDCNFDFFFGLEYFTSSGIILSDLSESNIISMRIASDEGYADYYDGFGWFGTLETLEVAKEHKLTLQGTEGMAMIEFNHPGLDETLFFRNDCLDYDVDTCPSLGCTLTGEGGEGCTPNQYFTLAGNPAGDPEGVTWAFRTGFLGAPNDGGSFNESNYLKTTECLTGENTIKLVASEDDTRLRYFRVTKHDGICTDETLCGLSPAETPGFTNYISRGKGLVIDNSVQDYLNQGSTVVDATGATYYSNELDCMAYGHCYTNGTLTRQGLISYDYTLSINFNDSVNISAPIESFENLILYSSERQDIIDFKERYEINPTKIISLVGNRIIGFCTDEYIYNSDYTEGTLEKIISICQDLDEGSIFESCCNPLDGIDCYESERTRFNITSALLLDIDNNSVPITGQILNSPSRPCAEDKVLIDSSVGYNPSSTNYYNNLIVTDEVNLITYESVETEIDGWSRTQPLLFYPYYISEETAELTSLSMNIRRYFHNIFNVSGEIVANATPPIPVNLIGLNPPHIHNLKYINESSPQFGIFNGSLISYENIGKDLKSNEYLNEEYQTSDGSVVLNYNRDFGIKAVGNIDFSTYEAALDPVGNVIQTTGEIQVNGNTISNTFNAYSDIDPVNGNVLYVWDNILNAVNEYGGSYQAYFAPYSDPNPNSNIKIVIIEAKDVGGGQYDPYNPVCIGSCFNGTLNWTIENTGTFSPVISQPIFSNIINGERYPILHVYEDFGYFDLLMTASDRDKNSSLYTEITISDSSVISTEKLSENSYISNLGIPYSVPFSWTTTNIGVDTPYYYPFYESMTNIDYFGTETFCVENNGYGISMIGIPCDDSEDCNGGICALILSDTGNDSVFNNTTILSTDDIEYNHNYLSHINSIFRISSIENKNGIINLAMRVIDNDAASDLITLKLIVHPKNDAPDVSAITDKTMFMNNNAYPNDINIEIKKTDIEETENNLSFVNFKPFKPNIVDRQYCDSVKVAIDWITNCEGDELCNAPEFINGISVLPVGVTRELAPCTDMTYCTTICYPSLGMSKERADELCSFANYNNDDFIDDFDYEDCIVDAQSFPDYDLYDVPVTSYYESEFSLRGGVSLGCVSNSLHENYIKTTSSLIYDMYAHYGVQIYPIENNEGSCNNTFTFAPYKICNTDNNNGQYTKCSIDSDCPGEEMCIPSPELFDSNNGCLNQQACLNYFIAHVVSDVDEEMLIDFETYTLYSEINSEQANSFCGNFNEEVNGLLDQNDDGIIGYDDLTIALATNTILDTNFCVGGMDSDKICNSNEDCRNYPVPNFLNFDDNDENLNNFLQDTGYNSLKEYIHFKPIQNKMGTRTIRIGVKDTGQNEDGTITQEKTNYSKIKINITDGSNKGPTGDLGVNEIASFGLSADTFRYTLSGIDNNIKIPTSIDRSFDINVYNYHPDTTEDNRIIQNCGYIDGPDSGVVSSDGSGICCSAIPVETQFNPLSFYNNENDLLINQNSNQKIGENPVYYKEEWLDELNLLLDYYKGNLSRWCDAQLTDVNWTYSDEDENASPPDYFINDNFGGFISENSVYNRLDYVISYWFEITDVVADYDVVGAQGGTDWWTDLGLEDLEWTNTWKDLAREGWEDLEGTRNVAHPLGETNKVIFKSPTYSQNRNTSQAFKRLLTEGFVYRYKYPSIYKVSVYALDTYKVIGETSLFVDARDIIKLQQTIRHKFSPWQGLNVIGDNIQDDIEDDNNSLRITRLDRDKRPSLGCWYYDDLEHNKHWYTTGYEATSWGLDIFKDTTRWISRYGQQDDNGKACVSNQSSNTINDCPAEYRYSHPYENITDNNFSGSYNWPVDLPEGDFPLVTYDTLCTGNIPCSAIILEDDCMSPWCNWNGDDCEQPSDDRALYNVVGSFSINQQLSTGHYPTGYPGMVRHCNSDGGGYFAYQYDDNIYDNLEEVCSLMFGGSSTDYVISEYNSCNLYFDSSMSGTAGTVIPTPCEQTLATHTQNAGYTPLPVTCDNITLSADNECIFYGCTLADETSVIIGGGPHYPANENPQYESELEYQGYQCSAEIGTMPCSIYEDCPHMFGQVGNGYCEESSTITTDTIDSIVEYHKLNDFIPDVDVRTPISLGSSNAILTKYYDKELQPKSWEESVAPLTAQFFFYPRKLYKNNYDKYNVFEEKPIMEDSVKNSFFYLGFIDYGDGSDVQYDTEPFEIKDNNLLTHTYEKSGIYDVTGTMFRVERAESYIDVTSVPIFIEASAWGCDHDEWSDYDCWCECTDGTRNNNTADCHGASGHGGPSCKTPCEDWCGAHDPWTSSSISQHTHVTPESKGVTHWREFNLTINVGKNDEVEEEFKLLGGLGYDFIPYSKTTPVISGVSDYSLYNRVLKYINGFAAINTGLLGYEDVYISQDFKFIGDQLRAELALSTIDEENILPLVSAFTGSYANISPNISDDEIIIEKREDGVCKFHEIEETYTCTNYNSELSCGAIDGITEGDFSYFQQLCSEAVGCNIQASGQEGVTVGYVSRNLDTDSCCGPSFECSAGGYCIGGNIYNGIYSGDDCCQHYFGSDANAEVCNTWENIGGTTSEVYTCSTPRTTFTCAGFTTCEEVNRISEQFGQRVCPTDDLGTQCSETPLHFCDGTGDVPIGTPCISEGNDCGTSNCVLSLEPRFICDLPDTDSNGLEFLLSSYINTNNQYMSALNSCQDTCVNSITADSIKGFFDGVVDVNGNLVGDNQNYIDNDGLSKTNTIKPTLINRGINSTFGELGNYLGDSDLAQIRYLNQPFSMWEILGFDCDSYMIPNPNSLLDRANIGINYRENSFDEINTEEITDTDGNYSATKLTHDVTKEEPTRFGYMFKTTQETTDDQESGTTIFLPPNEWTENFNVNTSYCDNNDCSIETYFSNEHFEISLDTAADGVTSLIAKCFKPDENETINTYYTGFGWWYIDSGLWDLTNATFCRLKWQPEDGTPNAFTHPAIISNVRLDSESWQFDNLSSTDSDLVNPILTTGQEYTFSTHIYIPSENVSDDSEPITIEQVQTCYLDNENFGPNDYTWEMRGEDVDVSRVSPTLFKLSDLVGPSAVNPKTLVIGISTSWCEPCQQSHGSDGTDNYSELIQEIQAWMQEQGIPLDKFVFVTLLLDENNPYSCQDFGEWVIEGSPPIVRDDTYTNSYNPQDHPIYRLFSDGQGVPYAAFLSPEGHLVRWASGPRIYNDTSIEAIKSLITGEYDTSGLPIIDFGDESAVHNEYPICYGAGMYQTMLGGTATIPGCTDPSACNYDALANANDGSCSYEFDCFDECGGTAEYDECNVCGGDNSSCSGCMDSSAINYDPLATIDNGTCIYTGQPDFCPTDSDICIWYESSNIMYYSSAAIAGFQIGQSNPSQNQGCITAATYGQNVPDGWTLAVQDSGIVGYYSLTNSETLLTNTQEVLLSLEGTSVSCLNWSEFVPDPSYVPVRFSDNLGNSLSWTFINNDVYGCTNYLADNYLWTANVDDGSCIYNEPDDYDMLLQLYQYVGEGLPWTQHTEFNLKQYDCYHHCHPNDANLGVYEWNNPYPMTNTLASGKSCWSATTVEACDGDCYWYDDGDFDGHYEVIDTITSYPRDEWFRVSGTFIPNENGDLTSIKINTPFKNGEEVYTWGAQLDIGNTMLEYTGVDIPSPTCQKADAGNPNHPRYWENIMPSTMGVENRYGVGLLPELPNREDPDVLDIALTWGNLYDDGMIINGSTACDFNDFSNTGVCEDKIISTNIQNKCRIRGDECVEEYREYLEIMYSLTDAGPSMILLTFDNLVIPVFNQELNNTTGGQTNPFNLPEGFSLYSDAINGLYILGSELPEASNEILVRFPIITRTDNFGISNENESIQMYYGENIIEFFFGGTENDYSTEPYFVNKKFLDSNIDETSNQNWINNYYYPVLPRINTAGEFDYERLGYQRIAGLGENKPFGTTNRFWSDDDMEAPITSNILSDKWINYSLIDLDFSEVETQVSNPILQDVGPITNYGILIDDYKINFEENPMSVQKSKPIIKTKINTDDEGKAY